MTSWVTLRMTGESACAAPHSKNSNSARDFSGGIASLSAARNTFMLFRAISRAGSVFLGLASCLAGLESSGEAAVDRNWSVCPTSS